MLGLLSGILCSSGKEKAQPHLSALAQLTGQQSTDVRETKGRFVPAGIIFLIFFVLTLALDDA